jgi:hypothetical protein
MEIGRPNDLGDIANLGLTLPEAKQVLARIRQAVVAAQAREHAVLRPDCSSCGGRCHVKDWRLHQLGTLFGRVTVRLPRWLCAGCGRIETGVRWPSYCRSRDCQEFRVLAGHNGKKGAPRWPDAKSLRYPRRSWTNCWLERKRFGGDVLRRAPAL